LLNPRAQAAWTAAALTVVLTSSSPVYRGIALAAAGLLVGLVPPLGEVSRRPLAIALAVSSGFAVLFNLLLSHTGATVLVELPDWIPLVGGVLTLEAAAFGLTTALGIAAGLVAAAPLVLQFEPGALLDALPRQLDRTAVVLAATFALVPGLARSYTAIREAQTMRGWRPRGPRSWSEVLVPVALTAVEDSLSVAEALEARAFGAARRTRLAAPGWGLADFAVLGASLLAAGAFVAARLAGWQQDWLVYPTPAPPPAEPGLLLAAALLLLPAGLAWRRSRG
jgi:energy-coupling factor transport system permease protein